jgi:hypothetical protein
MLMLTDLATNTALRYRRVVQGSVGTLLGILASGPLAVALVEATHPQPRWSGAERFAHSFHPVQIVPYAGGLLLVLSLLLLIASLEVLHRDRAHAALALLTSAVFACLICLNYALQTSYVPALSSSYDPADAPLLAMLSMSNPRSLAWAIEMWGWGFAGIATWLLAGVFGQTPLERAARATFVANGVVSVLGTLSAVLWPAWMMTGPGLVAFAGWNLLLALLASLTWAAFRRRLNGVPGSSHSP